MGEGRERDEGRGGSVGEEMERERYLISSTFFFPCFSLLLRETGKTKSVEV